MKIETTMFAVPIVGLIVGALLQPVGAQTYTYTRTTTSFDSPDVIERVVDDPLISRNQTILMERALRPVTIERPVIIERPAVIDQPLPIREPGYRSFSLGVFPLGGVDLF